MRVYALGRGLKGLRMRACIYMHLHVCALHVRASIVENNDIMALEAHKPTRCNLIQETDTDQHGQKNKITHPLRKMREMSFLLTSKLFLYLVTNLRALTLFQSLTAPSSLSDHPAVIHIPSIGTTPIHSTNQKS